MGKGKIYRIGPNFPNLVWKLSLAGERALFDIEYNVEKSAEFQTKMTSLFRPHMPKQTHNFRFDNFMTIECLDCHTS